MICLLLLLPQFLFRLVLRASDRYLLLSHEYNIEIQNTVIFKGLFQEINLRYTRPVLS
jgi:hypothetical protein